MQNFERVKGFPLALLLYLGNSVSWAKLQNIETEKHTRIALMKMENMLLLIQNLFQLMAQ